MAQPAEHRGARFGNRIGKAETGECTHTTYTRTTHTRPHPHPHTTPHSLTTAVSIEVWAGGKETNGGAASNTETGRARTQAR